MGFLSTRRGIYGGQDSAGNLLLNFTRINLIYDGLLEIGVAPFIELGFMPEELAERPSPHPSGITPMWRPRETHGNGIS